MVAAARRIGATRVVSAGDDIIDWFIDQVGEDINSRKPTADDRMVGLGAAPIRLCSTPEYLK